MGFDAGDWRLDPLPVRNPLGEDTSAMRTTMAPSMLAALGVNLNRGNLEARLFELSNAFKRTEPHQLPEEIPTLTMGMYGEGADFTGSATCGVPSCTVWHRGEGGGGGRELAAPGQAGACRAGEDRAGPVGRGAPDVAARFELENRRVYLAELSIGAMMASEVPVGEVKPLPRFPAVGRDIALVMDEGVAIGGVMETIRRAAGRTLEDVKLFDLYRGAQAGPGRKSAAFKLTFRAADRPRTDGEVSASFDKIEKACETTGARS